ncbi:MAG: hypothetical protein MUF81_10030 [Verrucomicrobia bacterium]|nr:hypothetical protein [Verrucomicrobiota bacterium]
MSSTRHTTTNGPLRQERFASSPEFERGLIASMVARRCSALDDPKDRELIWFLQYLSHQQGGLKAFAADLLTKYEGRLGSEAMLKIGKKVGQNYNAEEVRKIRRDLPGEGSRNFPLRGEIRDGTHWVECYSSKIGCI